MADIQTVTKGAQKAAKQVKANDALRKPAGLALAGAALAAIPYAAEKLGPKLSGKAGDVADSAKDKAKSQLKDSAKDLVPDSPGELVGGPLKRVFGGGDDADDEGDGRAAPGFGHFRPFDCVGPDRRINGRIVFCRRCRLPGNGGGHARFVVKKAR